LGSISLIIIFVVKESAGECNEESLQALRTGRKIASVEKGRGDSLT
jgi:hypothetical protein